MALDGVRLGPMGREMHQSHAVPAARNGQRYAAYGPAQCGRYIFLNRLSKGRG